jgi:hypothetical protein
VGLAERLERNLREITVQTYMLAFAAGQEGDPESGKVEACAEGEGVAKGSVDRCVMAAVPGLMLDGGWEIDSRFIANVVEKGDLVRRLLLGRPSAVAGGRALGQKAERGRNSTKFGTRLADDAVNTVGLRLYISLNVTWDLLDGRSRGEIA